jgi:hypothetical protein
MAGGSLSLRSPLNRSLLRPLHAGRAYPFVDFSRSIRLPRFSEQQFFLPAMRQLLGFGAKMLRFIGRIVGERQHVLDTAASDESRKRSEKLETQSSAIAAFTLAQFAFWGLIESGLISTEKASEMLTQGIAAHSKGDLANQKAAQMLQTILETVQRDRRSLAN